MAEKKITPKAAEGEKKTGAAEDKAATRVTKRKDLRRVHRKALKRV